MVKIARKIQFLACVFGTKTMTKSLCYNLSGKSLNIPSTPMDFNIAISSL